MLIMSGIRLMSGNSAVSQAPEAKAQVCVGVNLEVPAIAEPEIESGNAPAAGGAEGDWLCSWCLNHVANERDRFAFNGKDEFSFSNPEGIRFEIITFSHTLGCRQSGVPTLDNTWFPSYAWSYCLCGCCGQHLGWHYAGQHDFSGLIKNRIVRASYMRN
jgi:hypothetical protein